jgi:hypothetical protein
LKKEKRIELILELKWLMVSVIKWVEMLIKDTRQPLKESQLKEDLELRL